MKAKVVKLIPQLALVLLLVMVGTAQAKELVKVTIAGPGLSGEVKLTDPARVRVFRVLVPADRISKPASADRQPYFEFRLHVGIGTDIVATDVYHYYPARSEQPGYFYYDDVLNGSSSLEGQYFRLSDRRDGVLRALLTSLVPRSQVQRRRHPQHRSYRLLGCPSCSQTGWLSQVACVSVVVSYCAGPVL